MYPTYSFLRSCPRQGETVRHVLSNHFSPYFFGLSILKASNANVSHLRTRASMHLLLTCPNHLRLASQLITPPKLFWPPKTNTILCRQSRRFFFFWFYFWCNERYAEEAESLDVMLGSFWSSSLSLVGFCKVFLHFYATFLLSVYIYSHYQSQ